MYIYIYIYIYVDIVTIASKVPQTLNPNLKPLHPNLVSYSQRGPTLKPTPQVASYPQPESRVFCWDRVLLGPLMLYVYVYIYIYIYILAYIIVYYHIRF